MKKKCPKCGRFMKHINPNQVGFMWFDCSCGYKHRPMKTKRSFIDEADLRRSNERAISRMNLQAQHRW